MLQKKLEPSLEFKNEPELQKKIKTNRGRPKISTKTVISRYEKEYLQKETELVRMKFCFINRNEVALSTYQTLDKIKEKFSEKMFNLFVQITQIKEIFFQSMPDPADPNFKDNSDFGQLIDHFNQRNDHLDIEIIQMVFLQFLIEDMDEIGVISVIEGIKQFGQKFAKNDKVQDEIHKYKFQTQEYFKQLCELITILKNSLQTQFILYQEKIKEREKQQRIEEFSTNQQ